MLERPESIREGQGFDSPMLLFILIQKVPVVLIEKYPVSGTKIQLISESSCSYFVQALDCFLKSNPKLGGLIFDLPHFLIFSSMVTELCRSILMFL